MWPSWRLSWACGIFTNRPDTEASQLRYWTAALQTCHASMLETFQVPKNGWNLEGFFTLKKTSLHLGMVGFWPFKVWPDISWFRICQVCGLFQSWFVVVLGCSKRCFFWGGRVVGSIVVQNLFRDVLWYFKMDPFLWLFVEKFCASNFIPKKML